MVITVSPSRMLMISVSQTFGMNSDDASRVVRDGVVEILLAILGKARAMSIVAEMDAAAGQRSEEE